MSILSKSHALGTIVTAQDTSRYTKIILFVKTCAMQSFISMWMRSCLNAYKMSSSINSRIMPVSHINEQPLLSRLTWMIQTTESA